MRCPGSAAGRSWGDGAGAGGWGCPALPGPARPARRFSGCIHPSVRLHLPVSPSSRSGRERGSSRARAASCRCGVRGSAWPCGCWEMPRPQLCPATDTGSAEHGVAVLSVQCNVKYKAIFGCVHLVGFCAFSVPVPQTRAEEHQQSCILHVLSLLHRNRHQNTRFSCFYLTT